MRKKRLYGELRPRLREALADVRAAAAERHLEGERDDCGKDENWCHRLRRSPRRENLDASELPFWTVGGERPESVPGGGLRRGSPADARGGARGRNFCWFHKIVFLRLYSKAT